MIKEDFRAGIIIILSIVLFVILIVIAMIYVPRYRIYKQDLEGQANLRQQEREKQILIEEARAKNESAILDAERLETIATAEANREVIRAKGVAESNEIIAEGLKGNEEYLRYLWIEGLKDGEGDRIYIPTEAGIPILEAK